MPFSKSKPGGSSSLQGLKARRHRIALGAVAAGAGVAAIFRRKRRGGRDVLGVERTAEPIRAVAGAAEEAEVETTTAPPVAPRPVVAPITTSPKRPANSTPNSASGSIGEPTTGELSAEEASILSVLAQSGRKDDDRTAIAIATSLERETTDVAGVLRKLGNEGVVSGDLYTAAGDRIWAVTERGVRRLGAQH